MHPVTNGARRRRTAKFRRQLRPLAVVGVPPSAHRNIFADLRVSNRSLARYTRREVLAQPSRRRRRTMHGFAKRLALIGTAAGVIAAVGPANPAAASTGTDTII